MKLILLLAIFSSWVGAQSPLASPVNVSSSSGGNCSVLAGDVGGTCDANVIKTDVNLLGAPTVGTGPATGDSSQDIPSTTWVNNAIAAAQGSPGTSYPANQTISGCGVEYVSGLTFQVGACTYSIAGTSYTSPAIPLTLDPADVTNPRIDAIIVDVTGVASVLPGIADANPAQPTINPATQLQLTFAYIAANATTPTNITTTVIYDEGGEWTCAVTAHLTCGSTNNPYRGTKDVEATAAVLGNNVTFTIPASNVNLSTVNNKIFYIRSKGQWPVGTNGATAARYLSLFWLNGTTQVGQQVVLRDGTFGFSSSNTTAYQQISIPISLFGTGSNVVTKLEAIISGPNGSSSIGFYLDVITLQAGANNQFLPTGLMIFKGTWASTTAYNINDVVVSGGQGYVALVANTNVAVSTTSTWASLALSSTTGNAAAVVTTTFSATPTFTCPNATNGTVVDFIPSTALTTNITSATLTGCTTGSVLNFSFTQDGTGGRTVA